MTKKTRMASSGQDGARSAALQTSACSGHVRCATRLSDLGQGLKEPAQPQVAVGLTCVSMVTSPGEGPGRPALPLNAPARERATCTSSAYMSLAVCDLRDRRHKCSVCPKVKESWVLVDAGDASNKTEGS